MGSVDGYALLTFCALYVNIVLINKKRRMTHEFHWVSADYCVDILAIDWA